MKTNKSSGIPARHIGYTSGSNAYSGIGGKLLSSLEHSLSFQKLKTGKSGPHYIDGGVSITCFVDHGVSRFEVNIPRTSEEQPAVEVEKEVKEIPVEPTYLDVDNRFFVRVGQTSDVTLDELGHVVEDRTRYYWISFDDEYFGGIFFYPTEGQVGEVIDAYTEGLFLSPRLVDNGTLLDVVNFPDYMFHNYIRSFDLTQTVDDVERSIRFVAGYHFLATGDSIIYTPNIPYPEGGEIDGYGVSKNPPNRFFVDIESRTMAWYHVIQKWYVPPPPLLPAHTEATGSVSGSIIGIDIEEGSWSNVFETSFSLTGDNSEDYSVTTTGSDTIKEPIGIVSDIITLNRTEITLNIPLYSTPILMTGELDGGFNLVDCEAIETMTTQSCIALGYDDYQSAEVVYESGETADVPDTSGTNYYDVTACPGRDPCNLPAYEKLEDYWRYYETYQSWSEQIMAISIENIDIYGFASITRGRENGIYYESISGYVHGCTAQLGLGCVNRTFSTGATRTMEGYASGTFGETITASIPIQNAVIIESTNKYIGSGITIFRKVSGPAGAFIYNDLEQTLENWNNDSPLDYNSTFASLSDVEYPRDYTIQDPANWFSCLQYYPTTIPSLVANIPGALWYGPTISTMNTTTTVDECKVKEINKTFTASELVSISILDDRWSKGSQGIVVAVKSNASGESAVYHDGVDKTQDIVNALIKYGLIESGESLLDVGLI